MMCPEKFAQPPGRRPAKQDERYRCERSKCAWWCEGHGHCALKLLAESADHIASAAEAQFQSE
jgi:hypothetical protein